METEEACRAWKEEYELEFPVIADGDGTLFRAFTNGWVPWSVLVGPDGKVVFSENEFDESGFANAIQQMYARPPRQKPTTRARARLRRLHRRPGWRHRRARRRARATAASPDRPPRGAGRPRRGPHLPAVAALADGGAAPPEPVPPAADRLQRKGIEFRNAEVEGLDLDNKVVATASGDLDYDSLVVSLGAQLAPETVSGFEEMAYNLYTPDGCAQIHAALQDFREGVIGVLITAMPFKCPAAPYEAAFLAESFIRKRGIRRNVEIHLFTPEHTPMPVAPAVVGDSIADMLAARGIHYHPLFTFKELRPETSEVVSSDGQRTPGRPADRRPTAPGARRRALVPASRRLRLHPRRPRTLQTDYDGVYAIGDVATVKLPNGKALPKAGVFAHAEAKVVAQQIADTAHGKISDASFDGKGYCWIELGDGRAGFAGGNFYAEPDPQLKLRRPGRPLHWGKVAFEKWWLHHWL